MNSTPLLRRLAFTPLRDLLRFHITGSLDARSHIEALDLPDDAKQLIDRIVSRTRLWRSEKIDVADELASHFREGLASGRSMRDLIERFGDERAAAQLIRRAKRRERSWFWHVRHRAAQALGLLIVVYAGLIAYFLSGRAVIKVDYVAKLNAPVLATPEDQRAWPAYRDALIRLKILGPLEPDDESLRMKRYQAFKAMPSDEGWLDGQAMRRENPEAFEQLHAAAIKSGTGWVLRDYDDFGLGDPTAYRRGDWFYKQWTITPSPPPPVVLRGTAVMTLLPHLSELRSIAQAWTNDALVASFAVDRERFMRPIRSLVRLSDQLKREPLFNAQLVGVGIRGLVYAAMSDALLRQPDNAFLTDDDLAELLRALPDGRVASDLTDASDRRLLVEDLLQRLYTDDGNGNGRITLDGIHALKWMAHRYSFDPEKGEPPRIQPIDVFKGPSALIEYPDRRTVRAFFERRTSLIDAVAGKHFLLDDLIALEQQLDELAEAYPEMKRFAHVLGFDSGISWSTLWAAGTLTLRDGMRVGIALEQFRRQHGHYPASLDALVPGFLSEVPIDPVDGQPFRYRLTDQGPIVYSVGIDRDDDGGRRSTRPTALGGDLSDPPDGDWILFPVDPMAS